MNRQQYIKLKNRLKGPTTEEIKELFAKCGIDNPSEEAIEAAKRRSKMKYDDFILSKYIESGTDILPEIYKIYKPWYDVYKSTHN